MASRILLIVLSCILTLVASSESIARGGKSFDLTGFVDATTLKALTSVTRKYGQPVITNEVMKSLPFESKFGYANQIPWSSYWYPKIDDSIFSGPDSPLRKYDRFREWYYKKGGKSGPKSAADFEESNYDPDKASWIGRCDAWSLAAISKPEPKRPVTLNMDNDLVTFTVGDLKLLLMMTYENVSDKQLKIYGQKFTGKADGWFHPDILPNEFYRLIETHLFEKKTAFFMDHDPGPEVWNVPVYGAKYTLEPDPNGDPNSVFVTTRVLTVDSKPKTDKDYVGTTSVIRIYYSLLHGERNAKEDLLIHSGEWVKGPNRWDNDSRNNHPDFVTTVRNPLKLNRQSFNPEIEVELVDQILQDSY